MRISYTPYRALARTLVLSVVLATAAGVGASDDGQTHATPAAVAPLTAEAVESARDPGAVRGDVSAAASAQTRALSMDGGDVLLAMAQTPGRDLPMSSVAGRLTDSAGEPIPGGRAWLIRRIPHHPDDAASKRGTRESLRGLFVQSADASEDGTFVFESVPVGTWTAVGEADGYVPSTYPGQEGTSRFQVVAESDVSSIEIRLVRRGVIEGRLLSEEALGGRTRVEALARNGRDLWALSIGILGRGVFDPPRRFEGSLLDPVTGAYRIEDVPPGSLFVRADVDGYIPILFPSSEDRTDASAVVVTSGDTTRGIDLILVKGGAIGGRVASDEDGQPVAGARVSLEHLDVRGERRQLTAEDGTDRFSGLPQGRYLLRVRARGYLVGFPGGGTRAEDAAATVVDSPGQVIAGVDFGLRIRPVADFNSDGRVDFLDLIRFVARIGSVAAGEDDPYDRDGDGVIGFADFAAAVQELRGAGKVVTQGGQLQWLSVDGEADVITASLFGRQLPGLQGVMLEVVFDPEEAEYVKAESSGEVFPDGSVQVAETGAGRLAVTAGATRAGDVGSGTLLKLHFRPRTEAGSVRLRVERVVGLGDDGVVVSVPTPDAERLSLPPKTFYLLQNVPNPFNPETTISYELPEAVNVDLAIYNLVGQKVRSLVEEFKPPGRYQMVWDARDDMGRDVSSGVYFYNLTAGSFSTTRRMLLVR